jgi:hypothetical protein
MEQNRTAGAAHMALSVMRMLRPHRVEGFSKVRLGRFFDGGYVMLDHFENMDAAYSLGVSDDVSWDLDVANRGIPVFQYDHSITELPLQHELFNWEKIGIASESDPDRGLDTVPNLITKNGHERSINLLLKCDIEGHEWAIFSAMPKATLSKFRQIVVEVHYLDNLHDGVFANAVRSALSNILASHRVVHIHGNNFATWTVVGGVTFPAVLEITFARLDTGVFSVSDEIFPTALDMPCHHRAADFYLGRFAFD